jgi:hypothetical protein
MLQSNRYSHAGSEPPATLRRSCQEAQDTFTTARDSAVRVHGETDRADSAAFTVLKEIRETRRPLDRQTRSRRLTKSPCRPGILRELLTTVTQVKQDQAALGAPLNSPVRRRTWITLLSLARRLAPKGLSGAHDAYGPASICHYRAYLVKLSLVYETRQGVSRTAHAARRGHWCWQSQEAGAPERCLTADTALSGAADAGPAAGSPRWRRRRSRGPRRSGAGCCSGRSRAAS